MNQKLPRYISRGNGLDYVPPPLLQITIESQFLQKESTPTVFFMWPLIYLVRSQHVFSDKNRLHYLMENDDTKKEEFFFYCACIR